MRSFAPNVEELAKKLRRDPLINTEDCTPVSLSDRPAETIDATRWVEIDGCLGAVKRIGCRSTPSFGLDHPAQKEKIGIEKIASDLGYELGVAAVPCGLMEREGRYWAVSIYPFEGQPCGSFPNPKHGETAMEFGDKSMDVDQVLEDVKEANTALWAFHVWIGDQIEHTSRPDNMLLNVESGTPRIAAIDHASAWTKISNSNAKTEYLGPFNGRSKSNFDVFEKMDIAPHDSKILEETISKIEKLPKETIAKIVERIPDQLIPPDGKEIVAGNLIEGQANIRKRMSQLTDALSWKAENAMEVKMTWKERRQRQIGATA